MLAEASRIPRYQLKIHVYQRRIIALPLEIAKAKSKVVYAKKQLNLFVQPYYAQLHPALCENMLTKLLRELRDLVYEHTASFKHAIEVDTPTSFMVRGSKRWRDHLDELSHSRYFESKTVGNDLAREVSELFYRRSCFQVPSGYLKDLLAGEY
ncbi:hypothetical protein EJ02DRAFT_427672 [Clathrospora elynae]|uniref:Uncharacterized protein n=1 Tax=Clathrospora elynae TaxID=706981 RepID=A0A6A5S6Q2_9PLEO|nr:hypothetical protein EJ02DRAFT_427672 [Clathrospora elynae]